MTTQSTRARKQSNNITLFVGLLFVVVFVLGIVLYDYGYLDKLFDKNDKDTTSILTSTFLPKNSPTVSLTNIGCRNVTIGWNSITSAKYYIVQVDVQGQTAVRVNLTPSLTDYSYTFNGIDVSKYSNLHSLVNVYDSSDKLIGTGFKSAKLLAVPSTPTNFTYISSTATSLTCKWQTVKDATSYSLVLNDIPRDNILSIPANTDSKGLMTYTLKGIVSNINYHATIVAVGTCGRSSPSTAIQFLTGPLITSPITMAPSNSAYGYNGILTYTDHSNNNVMFAGLITTGGVQVTTNNSTNGPLDITMLDPGNFVQLLYLKDNVVQVYTFDTSTNYEYACIMVNPSIEVFPYLNYPQTYLLTGFSIVNNNNQTMFENVTKNANVPRLMTLTTTSGFSSVITNDKLGFVGVVDRTLTNQYLVTNATGDVRPFNANFLLSNISIIQNGSSLVSTLTAKKLATTAVSTVSHQTSQSGGVYSGSSNFTHTSTENNYVKSISAWYFDTTDASTRIAPMLKEVVSGAIA